MTNFNACNALFSELFEDGISVKDAKWAQTERNAFRQKLMDAFLVDFKEVLEGMEVYDEGMDVVRTNEGLTFMLPIDGTNNGVAFSIAPKIHEVDYDIYEAEDAYLTDKKAKAEKAAERKAKAEAKAAKAKAKKEA